MWLPGCPSSATPRCPCPELPRRGEESGRDKLPCAALPRPGSNVNAKHEEKAAQRGSDQRREGECDAHGIVRQQGPCHGDEERLQCGPTGRMRSFPLLKTGPIPHRTPTRMATEGQAELNARLCYVDRTSSTLLGGLKRCAVPAAGVTERWSMRTCEPLLRSTDHHLPAGAVIGSAGRGRPWWLPRRP
jgi:hypothetical protein